MAQKNPPEKPIFEVELAGIPLKLRSSHDDQTVKDLVNLVDSRISQAMPKVKHGSLQTAAILAALNIAEELMLLKRQAVQQLERLEHKAEKIITSLETSPLPKADA